MKTMDRVGGAALRGWRGPVGVMVVVGLALGACDSPGGGGGAGVYVPTDAGAQDAGAQDAGAQDAGTTDGGGTDAVSPDTSQPDTGPVADTTQPDGGPLADILTDAGPTATTIPALQAAAEATGCDPGGILNGAQVALGGVVVTSPKFDAYTPSDPTKTALDGYFVADPAGGAWSGLVVVVDRALATSFSPGDLVDIVGEHQEFYCLTQVEASSMSLAGTTAPPAPAPLAAGAVASEENEGRLVRVENVQVIEEAATGVYTMEGGFQVAHNFDFFLQLDVGARYDLVGEVGYSFGHFQLNPRSEGDVTLVGGGSPDASGGDTAGGDTAGGDVGPGPVETTISALNQSAESVGCTNLTVQTFPEPLTLEGDVLVGPVDLASTLWGYVINDGSLGPWSGLMVTWPKSLPGSFQVGDIVQFTGAHVEYYCQTEFLASEGVVVGAAAGGTLPDVTGETSWEQWEGSLVFLGPVTVSGDADWAAYGDLELDNGLIMDDWISGSGAWSKVDVGTTLTSVVGVVHYAFGSYRIAPRSADDIVY